MKNKKRLLVLFFCCNFNCISFGANINNLPDSFNVEIKPSIIEENQLVTVSVTAMKNGKIMENYVGDFFMRVEDKQGGVIQGNNTLFAGGGRGTITKDDRGTKTYEKEMTMKKKGNYILKVMEFINDNISGSAEVKVFSDDSGLEELNSYSQEYIDAYNWAYDKGITTKSLGNAGLLSPITRQAMAKMIVIFSRDVLGEVPDVNRACNFDDDETIQENLRLYTRQVCQLGIMGQGTREFNPKGTLTRAQFGTILSRILWGSKYEGGNPYYFKHLQALQANGIMKKINNAENTQELRGNVMIMLKRAEELLHQQENQ